MDLFDIAIARKLSGGGGGGGGGDSDFSTAQVTIINNISNAAFTMNCAIASDYEDEEESTHMSNYSTYTDPLDTTTESVILYKGKAVAEPLLSSSWSIAVTGGIVDDDGLLIITGDGTITIS